MNRLLDNMAKFEEFIYVIVLAEGIVVGAWARAFNKTRYKGKHRRTR